MMPRVTAMRVLLGLGHNRLTGVSTFALTLATELAARGHAVTVAIAQRQTQLPLLERAVGAVARLSLGPARPEGEFTHALLSDRVAFRHYGLAAPRRYFFAHGLGEPELEVHPDDVSQLSHLFCMSPFMLRHYQAKYPGLSSSFVPNFIDTERFAFAPSRPRAQNVLLNDRRSAQEYLGPVTEVAKALGLSAVPVAALNFGYPVTSPEKLLPQFDLVLAYGRSLYEAMSCGRNVVVFGKSGGDGFVTPDNFDTFFDRNCSGWATRALNFADPEVWRRLGDELRRHDPTLGRALRELVVDRCDVKRQFNRVTDFC